MTAESLNEQINKLMPQNLDDIVRINRDKLRLALATDEERKSLESVISETPVRHTLTHWQILMLHATDNGLQKTSPRLIGRLQESGEPWITSNVTGIDVSKGLVQTANSTYQIDGTPANEEDIDLMHICASLHLWGLGQFFGVPHIFY